MMIPIRDWAIKNHINRTTATEWARRKQINAEKKTVEIERWFVEESEKPLNKK